MNEYRESYQSYSMQDLQNNFSALQMFGQDYHSSADFFQ